MDTNLTGSILGSRSAMRVMASQPSGGRIFLMEGRGSRGTATPLNVAYGATKRALTQLKVLSWLFLAGRGDGNGLAKGLNPRD